MRPSYYQIMPIEGKKSLAGIFKGNWTTALLAFSKSAVNGNKLCNRKGLWARTTRNLIQSDLVALRIWVALYDLYLMKRTLRQKGSLLSC